MNSYFLYFENAQLEDQYRISNYDRNIKIHKRNMMIISIIFLYRFTFYLIAALIVMGFCQLEIFLPAKYPKCFEYLIFFLQLVIQVNYTISAANNADIEEYIIGFSSAIITFSLMLGSKFYLKLIAIVTQLLSVILGYRYNHSLLSLSLGAYLISLGIWVNHLYLLDKQQRESFLIQIKEQRFQQFLNKTQNFSILECYYDQKSHKIYYEKLNEQAVCEFQIDNQISFREFMRSTLIVDQTKRKTRKQLGLQNQRQTLEQLIFYYFKNVNNFFENLNHNFNKIVKNEFIGQTNSKEYLIKILGIQEKNKQKVMLIIEESKESSRIQLLAKKNSQLSFIKEEIINFMLYNLSYNLQVHKVLQAELKKMNIKKQNDQYIQTNYRSQKLLSLSRFKNYQLYNLGLNGKYYWDQPNYQVPIQKFNFYDFINNFIILIKPYGIEQKVKIQFEVINNVNQTIKSNQQALLQLLLNMTQLILNNIKELSLLIVKAKKYTKPLYNYYQVNIIKITFELYQGSLQDIEFQSTQKYNFQKCQQVIFIQLINQLIRFIYKIVQILHHIQDPIKLLKPEKL